jgi:hypothetical protein
MSSDDKSSVGESFVQRPRIMKVAAYLIALSVLLFYALAALWPSAPLIVSSLQPSRGSTEGGTSVTISGVGFATGVTVLFDGAAATISNVTNTSIVLTTPKHKAAKVRVQVADPNGQEVAVPDGFTYVDPIIITQIKPISGSPGDQVSITGSGFPVGTQVRLGGISAGNVNMVSSTQLTATTPEHSLGPVDLEVSDNSGGKALVADGFKFVKVADQTDASKTETRTVKSTYTGADVWSNEYRSADATNLYSIKYLGATFWLRENARLLLIVMIVGALGSLIHVFHSFYWYVGNRQLRNSWLLMYLLLPFNGAGLALLFYLIIRGGISSQAPITQSSVDGYAAMAALVGLFSREAQAKLKKVAESFFSTAAKGNDQATTSTTLSITGITPASDTSAGGKTVTITGTGFSAGSQVKFGDVHAENVNVASGTQLTVTAPAHAPGVVDVEVATSSGTKASSSRAFTYTDAAVDAVTVTGINPAFDTSAGGTTVTITGTGFSAGSQVKFGDVPAEKVDVASGTQLMVTTPKHPAGTVDVEVTTSSGTKASSSGAFTYKDAVVDAVTVTR